MKPVFFYDEFLLKGFDEPLNLIMLQWEINVTHKCYKNILKQSVQLFRRVTEMVIVIQFCLLAKENQIIQQDRVPLYVYTDLYFH